MAKRTLDEIDRRLLALLRADARTPAALLARRVGLSRSAVQARLARLERDRVIAGYTVLLGDAGPAPAVAAHVMVTLDPKRQDQVIAALGGLPEVTRAHTVSGPHDLLLEVAADSAAALDQLLTRIGRLPGVLRTTSSILLGTAFDRR
jgi:DNA-binding Lrp family transcriptional regulator